MTTMKEIAEKTGVSISTVSLVLNGRDEGRVNPAPCDAVYLNQINIFRRKIMVG